MDDQKVGITPTSAQAASTPAPGHSPSPSFTPGPWVTDERYPYCVYSDDATGSIVAKCGRFDFVYRSDAEMEANTRLIAAAPDLYAVLTEIDDYLTNNAPGTYVGRGSILHRKVSTVLKAARGEVSE